jgi:alkaline phosphatase D
MLFMGDFIYIDVPHRFGEDVETYRSEYRRVYSSPDWEPATQELPWIHVIDDHEIANDWDKNTTGIYHAAVDPFTHYHVAANPDPVAPGETYAAFTQGPVSIFMLESRRHRTPESKNATDPSKSMLGKEQRSALLNWLSSPPEHPHVRWKIIVSSVPFTKNWRFGDTDTWGTYLYERSLILDAAWKASRKQGVGIIVISGDRHEFAATRFPDPTAAEDSNQATDVLEFSVSPLNMFYLPIKTYRQLDDEDVELLYAPDGQQKFGAIDITVDGEGRSVLKFRLFVGGRETWSFETVAPEAEA